MTLGYEQEFGFGRVAAGEYDQVFIPDSPHRGGFGVVLCHGSGNPRAWVDPVAQPASVRLAGELARAGIACIAGDFGGQTWGNDTILSRIDAAWAVLKTRVTSIRSDKLGLVGGSMGAAGAARYCQLHPERVAAMIGLIPLLDLTAFYAANPGAVANEVAGAWGVVAPAALPAGANIAANAALAKSVPLLAGYSTVDTTVLPAWVLAYVAAVGGTAMITDTTVGHSDQAIAGMPIPTAGQFLVRYGA